MTRIRLVHLIVQPVLMADDGDTLTPLNMQPVIVGPGALDAFPAAFRAELAEQEARMNQAKSDPAEPEETAP